MLENVQGDKLIWDSGLYNKYGESIYMLGDWDGDLVSKSKILDSNQTALGNGFRKTDIPNAKTDARDFSEFLICSADLEDFKSLGVHNLRHIIDEREERSNWPTSMCAEDRTNVIRNSLAFSLNRLKENPFLLSPTFNPETSSIHYLVPLRFTSSPARPPLSYLVIRRVSRDMWDVATILDRETALRISRIILPFRGDNVDGISSWNN
jgi:hypothetical protein